MNGRSYEGPYCCGCGSPCSQEESRRYYGRCWHCATLAASSEDPGEYTRRPRGRLSPGEAAVAYVEGVRSRAGVSGGARPAGTPAP